MDTLLYILLALAAAGVVYVLARGVVAMANGRDLSGRTSNKFMSYRVVLQLAAIVLVLIIAYAGSRG